MPELPRIFSDFPEDARRRVTMEKGRHVFHRGDKARGLYAIERGTVELRRTTEDGVDIVIFTARAGDTFAEASVFSESYHCDAIALSDCALVLFDRQTIMRRFHEDPAFSVALARSFAGQIQAYRRRIELLAIRDSRARVFAAIAEGMLTRNIKSFASEIGLTHETVYRALSDLVAQRRIAKTGYGRYLLPATKSESPE